MTSEMETIVQCYESVRGSFSADRVIVDPKLNEHFIGMCREAGLSKPAAKLNQRLLNIRKRGHLPKSDRTVETRFVNEEEYRYAAEIAARILQRRDGRALDVILCDPDLCRQLDELAEEISPGFSPLQYRWAALNLRKAKRAIIKSCG